jgi:RNase P subunit RPR2
LKKYLCRKCRRILKHKRKFESRMSKR